MSRLDEDPGRSLEDLLEMTERGEAAALRAELVAFLQSPAYRAEVESIIQKPLEAVVISALNNKDFQTHLRDAVIASLKPEITKAAQTAASEALSKINVTITEDVKQAMRANAEEALKGAWVNAQLQAASAPRHTPRIPANSDGLLTKAALVFFVIIVLAIGWFAVKRNRPETTPADTLIVEDSRGTEGNVSTPTPQPSLLFQRYKTALEAESDLPPVTAEQLQCVEDALKEVERGNALLDVAALHASLKKCVAMKSRPSGASPMIATVQTQLTTIAGNSPCAGLKAVTNDGKHGGQTSEALSAYLNCTRPEGVPDKLVILADYVAVGIYFVYERDYTSR